MLLRARAAEKIGVIVFCTTCDAGPTSLGFRLNHSQKATAAASIVAERKLAASLSYRVATRRKSFNRQNMASISQRSR